MMHVAGIMHPALSMCHCKTCGHLSGFLHNAYFYHDTNCNCAALCIQSVHCIVSIVVCLLVKCVQLFMWHMNNKHLQDCLCGI